MRTVVYVKPGISENQRWSGYNTNVHNMITLEKKKLECNHDYFHEYPVSNIKATFMESLGVILFLLLCSN